MRLGDNSIKNAALRDGTIVTLKWLKADKMRCFQKALRSQSNGLYSTCPIRLFGMVWITCPKVLSNVETVVLRSPARVHAVVILLHRSVRSIQKEIPSSLGFHGA